VKLNNSPWKVSLNCMIPTCRTAFTWGSQRRHASLTWRAPALLERFLLRSLYSNLSVLIRFNDIISPITFDLSKAQHFWKTKEWEKSRLTRVSWILASRTKRLLLETGNGRCSEWFDVNAVGSFPADSFLLPQAEFPQLFHSHFKEPAPGHLKFKGHDPPLVYCF